MKIEHCAKMDLDLIQEGNSLVSQVNLVIVKVRWESSLWSLEEGKEMDIPAFTLFTFLNTALRGPLRSESVFLCIVPPGFGRP